MASEIKAAYHSCFIVDVKVQLHEIILTDSAHNVFIVDIHDTDVLQQFKIWFKTEFLHRQSQHTTILKYVIVSEDADVYMKIIKFVTDDEKVV